MQNRCPKNRLTNALHLLLIATIIMLPATPLSSIAAENIGNEEIEVLEDQSKVVVLSTDSDATEKTAPETSKTSPAPESDQESEEPDEAMSTGMKVALGVGGGVVAIAGIAALAGGSGGDSSPKPPTQEQMVGPWQANAFSVDDRTYSGTYTLYAGGSHSYDLYISDGTRKVGSGAWRLVDYALELRNFSGSTYRGGFAPGVKNSATLTTTDNRWKLTITK